MFVNALKLSMLTLYFKKLIHVSRLFTNMIVYRKRYGYRGCKELSQLHYDSLDFFYLHIERIARASDLKT